MKYLKFTPALCAAILAGEKRATWRLFDDKDLTVGDMFACVNNATMETIGVGTITKIVVKTLGTISDEDWTGHERYDSEEAMYAAYRALYKEPVTSDSQLKLVTFTFVPALSNNYEN